MKHTKFEIAELLETPEDIANYIQAVMEDNDPAILTAALGHVARAKGMTEMERLTGITRKGLYKALSDTSDPKYTTVSKVLNSLGLRLSVEPLPVDTHAR